MSPHPDLPVERVRAETFASASRAGFSEADARDMSLAVGRAERERREIAEEADWITRRMLEKRVQ